MKSKTMLAFIGIFILLLIITLLIIANHNGFIFKSDLNNSSSAELNPTINPTLLASVDPNSTLTFPPNDYAINHINWSSYPNLQTGYVYTACVSEPTDVIPYKFVEVEIVTEVKDTENKTIIKDQLAGVAREAKKIYGPSSSIDIIGTKGGVARWFASILPYEDTIH